MSTMTPEQWRDKQTEMESRHEAERGRLFLEHESIVFPETGELRPATARDIQEGAVIYYPIVAGVRDNAHWQIVSEVRYPSDDFKAYVSEDGCRYGLHGAYVRKSPTPPQPAKGGEEKA